MSNSPWSIRGRGPELVLVHGSATDADAWALQVATLSRDFTLLRYHRPATPAHPLPQPAPRPTVAFEVETLWRHLDALPQHGPWLLCASSYGAIVCLEAALARPDEVRGLVLCEPPLPLPELPSADDLHRELERRAATDPDDATRWFLTQVLGPDAAARLPRPALRRALALGPAIRRDTAALAHYTPTPHTWTSLPTPTLLLGGDRSPPYFAHALDALARHLPRARRVTLHRGGHNLHVDAQPAFERTLRAFVETLRNAGS